MAVQVHSGKRGKYNNANIGNFFPSHPEKYCGSTCPQFKSSLELRMMQYLDKNSSVVKWAYEPQPIQYIDMSSVPPRVRRYYIDFVATIKSGIIQKIVWIEVKPLCEAQKPKNTKDIQANLLWIKNNCKWNAAKRLAQSKGYEFHIITEEQLN